MRTSRKYRRGSKSVRKHRFGKNKSRTRKNSKRLIYRVIAHPLQSALIATSIGVGSYLIFELLAKLMSEDPAKKERKEAVREFMATTYLAPSDEKTRLINQIINIRGPGQDPNSLYQLSEEDLQQLLNEERDNITRTRTRTRTIISKK